MLPSAKKDTRKPVNYEVNIFIQTLRIDFRNTREFSHEFQENNV